MEFKRSNVILGDKLKKTLEQRLTKPIKHEEIISQSELKQNCLSYCALEFFGFLFFVVFFAAINFVSRGLEFHEQFKIDSFIVNPY